MRTRPEAGMGYRPGLDGVRALAVAGVVLYHAQVAAVPGGYLGVDVFFVLSGFLITSILLREHARAGGVRLGRFWLARARRLLPAALLVIAVSLVVVAVAHPVDLRPLRGDALSSLFYVNNWHQVFAHRSYFDSFARPSLLRHFWSLAVEEQFYLVWPPLLVVLLRRLGRRDIALLAGAAALTSAGLMAAWFDPHHDPSRVYYGTDTRAMPILVGVVLAAIWPVMGPMRRVTVRTVPRGVRAALDVVGLVGLAGVVAAMLSWTDYDPFVYRGGLLLVALAAALLVAAVSHPASRVGVVLAAPPLVWLGRRSYGIYLWHWPVMALSRPGLDVRVSAWELVPLQVGATLALAAASYRWVEMPVRSGRAQGALRAWVASRDPAQRRIAFGTTAVAVVAFAVAVAAWPVPARHVPFTQTASAQATKPVAALSPLPQPRPVAPSPVSRHRHHQHAQPAASPSPVHVSPAASFPAVHGQILAVGASVMLAAIDQLHRQLHATVDAAVNRQPYQIIDRLEAYRSAHALPPIVVVQIGENGPLSSTDVSRLRTVLSGVRLVVLMNLRYPGESWIDATNRQLAHLAATWPNARLADWRSASADPHLLWDGTHPDPAGAVVYARTVAQAIGG